METQTAEAPVKFMTMVKRESKSYEAIQQSVLLGILIQHGFGVEITVPLRIASKSLHFFQVKEIYCNNNPIKFGEIIDTHCNRQYAEEMKQTAFMTTREEYKRLVKNIKRRKEINHAALSFNTICGLVEDMKYVIDEKQVKAAKMTIQMKKIKTITKPNGEIIDEDMIYSIGKEINEYLTQLSTMNDGNSVKSFILFPNDLKIQMVMNQTKENQNNSFNSMNSMNSLGFGVNQWGVGQNDSLQSF